MIAKNRQFNWEEIVTEAKMKEAAVDPIELYNILQAIPSDAISSIRCTSSFDSAHIKRELAVIAEDIFKSTENSLNDGSHVPG